MSDAENNLVEAARAGDRDAALAVIELHMVKVRVIASRIRNCSWDDLLQEGRLAVLEAIQTFDAKRGSFGIHAAWRVKKRLWQLRKEQLQYEQEQTGRRRRRGTHGDEESASLRAWRDEQADEEAGRRRLAMKLALRRLSPEVREDLASPPHSDRFKAALAGLWRQFQEVVKLSRESGPERGA